MTWNTDTLRRLIADRKPGHALDRAFYRSDEVFQADLALIFGRHWIQVAIEPDVPEPGDAVTVDIGTWSVIIVRDDDMQIHAFHNVCRHRGARIVRQRRAMVGNLVCPYHTWTYGLDGRLLFANHMDDDFDPSCHGLNKVALRSIAGLLFICLADDPPSDIDDLAAAMTPYLAPHDIASTRIAHEVDLIERGNWKLTMENNRECYHCAGNHPELTVPLFAYGFGFAPERLDEAARHEADRYSALVQTSHAAWEQRGIPSREIEHLDDRISGFRTERLPIDQHGESQTIDTRSACRRLLGTLDDRRLGGLSFWTQPNSWHHFMSDHIVTFSALPARCHDHARAYALAGPPGRGRGCRLRSRQPHRSLERDQRAGRSPGRNGAGRHQQPRLHARSLFAVHRRPGRQIPAGGISTASPPGSLREWCDRIPPHGSAALLGTGTRRHADLPPGARRDARRPHLRLREPSR